MLNTLCSTFYTKVEQDSLVSRIHCRPYLLLPVNYLVCGDWLLNFECLDRKHILTRKKWCNNNYTYLPNNLIGGWQSSFMTGSGKLMLKTMRKLGDRVMMQDHIICTPETWSWLTKDTMAATSSSMALTRQRMSLWCLQS